MSVMILPGIADLEFKVEVAWGGDPNALLASEWTWTDITTDVRVKDGINIKVGRGDEASKPQPASCTMTLDNRGNKYSTHGLSVNYPNVRRSVPVKVSVKFVTNWKTLFLGYADSWIPKWNIKGNDATVKLSASGTLRRLQQNQKPLISPLRRTITSTDGIVAYWPAEEGKNSEVIRQAVGNREMIVTANANMPNFAASSDFDASYPLPKLNGSAWRGIVNEPPLASTGFIGLRCLFDFPDSGVTANNQLMSIWTNGQVELWQVRYGATEGIRLTAWSGGVQILDTGTVSYDNLLGNYGQLALSLEQAGTAIYYRVDWVPYPAIVSGFFDGSLSSKTLGSPTLVDINWDGGNEQVAVGHISVYNVYPGVFSDGDALRAYSGENPSTRMNRIEEENSIYIGRYSDEGLFSDYARIGAQPLDTFLNVLYDSAGPNQDIVYDGLEAGITVLAHSYFENAPIRASIDASGSELAPPFDIYYDDQNVANRVTINRTDGVSITVEKTDGMVGTDAVGVFDSSETINFDTDAAVEQFANWRLMQGTVEGYRVPQVTVSLAHTPELKSAFDASEYRSWFFIGERITIENLDQVLDFAPAVLIDLMIEGYEITVSSHEFTFTANCSNAERWRVSELGSDTGSTDTDFVQRLDTAGAELASAVAQGASSMSVTTTVPPIFTTTATRPNDFPFYIEVEGIQIEVTGISGTSSPQTFTVNSSTVTKALSSGASVTVADVPALDM